MIIYLFSLLLYTCTLLFFSFYYYIFLGPWSSEEVDKLCQVMVREHGIEDCQLPPNVTWDMISRAVITRSAMQCRFKW